MRPARAACYRLRMRLFLALALPALAAGLARADGFDRALDAALHEIRFERGERGDRGDRGDRRGRGGDWIDREERQDRRQGRERDEWERRWRRDHPDQPRPPRDRDDGPGAAPAPASRPVWGRRYGDWDETYHSGWRRDPRGLPLWWGWASWPRDSGQRCEDYYEALEGRCEAACGDELPACTDACDGDRACARQCSDEDSRCRVSCDEEKTEDVNARCP